MVNILRHFTEARISMHQKVPEDTIGEHISTQDVVLYHPYLTFVSKPKPELNSSTHPHTYPWP